jgi:aspartate/glutamate racemase
MESTLSWATVIVALISAGFGVRAATVTVRNSMDHFIEDLQRQGRWAAIAAALAACAACLQVIERALL